MIIKTLTELGKHVGETVHVKSIDGFEGDCTVIQFKNFGKKALGLGTDSEALYKDTYFWRVDETEHEEYKPFKYGHHCTEPHHIKYQLDSIETIDGSVKTRKVRTDKGKHHVWKKKKQEVTGNKEYLMSLQDKSIEEINSLLKDTTFIVNDITVTFKIVNKDTLKIKSDTKRLDHWLINDKEDYAFVLYMLGLIPYDETWCYFPDEESDELYKNTHTDIYIPTKDLIKDIKPLPLPREAKFRISTDQTLFLLQEILTTLKEIKEKI